MKLKGWLNREMKPPPSVLPQKILTNFSIWKRKHARPRRRFFGHLNAQYAVPANFANAQNPFTFFLKKEKSNRL